MRQSRSSLTRSNYAILWLAGGLIVAASLAHGDGTPGATRWAFLHISVALGIAWFAFHFIKTGTARLGAPHLAAFALFGYAALSLLWSSDPQQGLHQLFNATGLLAAFLVAPYIRQAIPAALMVAMAGALVLAQVAPAGTFGGFGNENFITAYLLIALPFGLLAPSFGLLVGVIAVAYLVFWNGSKAEWFVGGFVALISLWWSVGRRQTNLVAASILTAIGAGSIGLLWPIFRDSVVTRAELWVNTARLIADAPILGHGFGSFMYEFPRLQEWHIALFPDWGIQQHGVAHHAGAAHNEYLQLFAELGIVGLALGIGLIASLFLPESRRGRPGDAIHLAALAAVAIGAVVALIDFPAQNAATGLLLALAIGVLSGKGRKVVLPAGLWPRAVVGGAVALGLIVAIGHYGIRSYVAQVEMAQAREAMRDGRYAHAVQWNELALRRLSWDWRIRIQYPLALSALIKQMQPDELSPRLQDHYYRVGASASPDLPALMIMRFEDLLNTERNADEAFEIYERLKAQAPLRARQSINHIEGLVE